MSGSWKIGAVSGLIAGIFAGIVAIVTVIFFIDTGLQHWYLPRPPIPSLTYVTIITFSFTIIWGIILGIIYSRFYDFIPRKKITKGLVYGLILGLIYSVRAVSFFSLYSPSYVIGNIISISEYVVYGLLLGILYELLLNRYYPSRKEMEVSKPDVLKGIFPGAIAGIIGSVVITISFTIFWYPIDFPQYMGDINFIIIQLGAHSFINMIWGIVFGILFVMFYEKIPSKGVLKGILFGMMLFFITSFRTAIWSLCYGIFNWFVSWGSGVFLFFIFGLIIGLLYRKPSE